ncbi:MAG: hypothetical protein JEZ06_02735 [Anaerolineaceae bacterium]|nr:hypothetical protein [Anaerolineaceae bacterium]
MGEKNNGPVLQKEKGTGVTDFIQKPDEASLKQQERLSIEAKIDEAGKFEVIAITAGIGNGWDFTSEALEESVSLWEGAQCFVDHGGWFRPRSIRDLGGVMHSPEWDPETKGIKMQLEANGPAGKLITEIGRLMVAEEEKAKPQVGFSADVIFTAKQKKIEKIMRVNSIDLVIRPARGGAFVRALNQLRETEEEMGEKTKTPQTETQTETQTTQLSQIEQDREAVRVLLAEQEKQEALAEEATKAREVRAQMCGYLLDTALAGSKLPEAVQKRVRARFSGKIFEPADLQSEIEDQREMLSEITGAMVVQGQGRIQGMFSSDDQLQAAVQDMLGAPRDENLKEIKAARLSGIRELYMMMTGDYDLHGGYYSDRVRLATTADFTGLVKNALNKIVVNTWEELGRAGYDWWKHISVQEHFNSLNGITGTLVGTVGDLPTVLEGGAYTELNIGDSPETASFTKYGGYIPLTMELIDRDETRKLKAYPRELASAGLRKISKLVAAIFTENSGIGPTMADTGALFNATAVTTAGGHANLLTTALAAAAWEAACTAVYNQAMLIKNAAGIYGTGPKMAINPKFCLVPRALQLAAMKILYPTLENAANIYSENQQRGQPGDVITVPEWTDATDWAAVCDPRLAPAIYVGERFGIMPEIYIAGDETNGAVFTNDEHRLKVRHFLAVWVNDYRPLHKSNVA